MAKRKRRKLSDAFKADAVRLVRVGDKSVGQVAKDLDLTESALRGWVQRADVDDAKSDTDALTRGGRKGRGCAERPHRVRAEPDRVLRPRVVRPRPAQRAERVVSDRAGDRRMPRRSMPGPSACRGPGSVDLDYRDTTILHGVSAGAFYADYVGDVDGDGVSDTGMDPLPLDDGVVTVHVTGGRDVPAFRQLIAVPMPFTAELPASVSRSGDLRVTWAGAAADDMELIVNAPHTPDLRMVICHAPVDDGELAVPAALLGQIAEASELLLWLRAREIEHVAAGDYAIEVVAYHGVGGAVSVR